MSFSIERYKDFQRFNEQYEEIYQFLLAVADNRYNEHFHWGRFEWMMMHTMLDVDKLNRVAIFRDENDKITGLVTYDTEFEDSTYLIHLRNDIDLLKLMVDFALLNYENNGKIVIKVNSNDNILCDVLSKYQFIKKNKKHTVLQIGLSRDLTYQIPPNYKMSPKNFVCDDWKYQMVIHKGFNHEGIPEKWNDDFFKPTPNYNRAFSVFAMNIDEYCAHCGIWYTKGETAYIEPVVTIPECRNIGLAKAVVYEAMNRAKELGAKRAIVLSGKEFYYRIGFEISSEVYCWEYNKFQEIQ